MMDVMPKLNKINCYSSNPPLLPLPSTPPTTLSQCLFQPLCPPSLSTQQILSLSSIPLTCPTRLEILLFNGENVLGWLLQINQFFVFHTVDEDQKIFIDVFYITGATIKWYHWISATGQLSTCADFTKKLKLSFGTSSFINHEA